MAAQGRSSFAWDLRQPGNQTAPGERNGKVWKRMEKKLPLGIQSFEGLRKDGYTYVDKREPFLTWFTEERRIF